MKVLYVLIIAVLASCFMSCAAKKEAAKQKWLDTGYWTNQISESDRGALFYEIKLKSPRVGQPIGAFWDAQKRAMYIAEDYSCKAELDDECDEK